MLYAIKGDALSLLRDARFGLLQPDLYEIDVIAICLEVNARAPAEPLER